MVSRNLILIAISINFLIACAPHWEGPISPYEDKKFVTHKDIVFSFDLIVEGRPLSKDLPHKDVELVHSIQCSNTNVCNASIDKSISNNRVTITPYKEGVTQIQNVSVHPVTGQEFRLSWPIRVITREAPRLDIGVKLVERNTNPTSLMYHGVKQKYFCQDSLTEEQLSKELRFDPNTSEGRLVLTCHPKRGFQFANKFKFFDYARSGPEEENLRRSDVVACLSLDANQEIIGYRLYYRGRMSDKFAPGKIKGGDSFGRCKVME